MATQAHAAQDTFHQDAHALKEQITALIEKFESKHSNQGVTMNRTPKDGLSMTIRPLTSQVYTVRGGDTVPIAQSKGARSLPAPAPAAPLAQDQ